MVIFTFTFLITAFLVIRTYGSEEGFPGSDGDPLITKSYLEKRLKETPLKEGFRKVKIKKKAKLLLKEGSEILIYKGSGRVTGDEGLINVTQGVLFEKEHSLVKYHLFLAPSDNCGIIANDRVIAFVSGEYQIK